MGIVSVDGQTMRKRRKSSDAVGDMVAIFVVDSADKTLTTPDPAK